jgi:intein/homing endonuclease
MKGYDMKIKKITKNSTPSTVYDFTVKDVHHYLLENGVVTHNSYVPTKALSGGCLVAGTLVMLPDGSTKAIEDFVVGDEVSTAYGPCVVTSTFKFTDKPVYELELDNGEIIRCSEDHRFIVDGEWVCAKEIQSGDDVAVVRNINSDRGQHDLSLLLPNNE